MREILSWLAGVFCVAGFAPYIIAILKGRAKPSKATWIIWGTLDGILLAGMWLEKSINLQIVFSTIGASAVALLSLKYGISGWRKIDKWCLAGALLGILLLIFSSPLLGILTSLAVIFIGSIPTFTSAWKHPEDENKTAWLIFLLSALCSVAAIPKWTWEDAAQPIVFLTIETIMIYIVCIKPSLFLR